MMDYFENYTVRFYIKKRGHNRPNLKYGIPKHSPEDHSPEAEEIGNRSELTGVERDSTPYHALAAAK